MSMTPGAIKAGVKVKIAVTKTRCGGATLNKGDVGTATRSPNSMGAFRADFPKGNYIVYTDEVSPA